ncbi:MAG: hypothetical protein RLZ35_251 [Pseudomonadota bacterium]|jgi:arginine N-succinyltransferase
MSAPIDTAVFIRPLCLSDVDRLLEILSNSDITLTSLPANKAILTEKLSRVESSFKGQIPQDEQLFLFGLVREADNTLIGTCGIKPYAGNHSPFYQYKVSKMVHACQSLNTFKEFSVLSLVNDHQASGELCSLFITPDERKKYRGAFLSRARFLFIATYLSQFPEHFIAQMHGFCDKQGESPFWNGLVKPFFDMTFSEADYLRATTNRQFIVDLMPKYPIYTQFLNKETQEVIGKVHPNTEPALHFLLAENFEYHAYIDIFDAGPIIEAQTDHIRTIQNNRVLSVQDIQSKIKSPTWALISNTPSTHQQHLFLATVGEIAITGEACTLHTVAAKRLGISIGDTIRICPFL